MTEMVIYHSMSTKVTNFSMVTGISFVKKYIYNNEGHHDLLLKQFFFPEVTILYLTILLLTFYRS